MASIRSLLTLTAALGAAGAQAGTGGTVGAELRAARLRASAALVAASEAIDHRQAERAIDAMQSAWQALASVPGGEAFQDLVVLDEATAVAQASLQQRDAATARLAMDAALTRLHA